MTPNACTHRIIRCMFVVMLCLTPALSFEKPRLEHLGVGEGLSQSTVYAMLQDSRGFIWIGTRDGLNRYDGQSFTVVGKRTIATHALGIGSVRALAEDAFGSIWVGTEAGGLYRYTISTGVLDHVQERLGLPSESFFVRQVAVFGEVLWGVTGSGEIFALNIAPGLRYPRPIRLPEELGSLHVLSVSVSPTGNVCIGALRKIIFADTSSILGTVPLPGGVISMYHDPMSLWVVVKGRGLARIISDNNGTFRQQAVLLRRFRNPLVTSIARDDDGHLWAGTSSDGIYILDTTGTIIFHITKGRPIEDGLHDSNIRSLMIDRTGMVWIGTNTAGMYTYSRFRQKFRSILPGKDGSGRSSVLSFAEDIYSNVWVGTEGSGIVRYGPEVRSVLSRRLAGDHGRSTIVTMLRARDGSMWIGTDGGGLEHRSSRNRLLRRFTSHPDDPSSLSDDHVLTLLEGRSGLLWVGTFDGLNAYDPARRTFRRYLKSTENNFGLSDGRILSLYEDENGLLWIGTHSGGLNILDPSTGDVTQYRFDKDDITSISSDRVNVIHRDAAGRTWLGTYGGLDQVLETPGTFRAITTEDGLPNDVVYGILEDEDQNLWLSTNAGICRFDPGNFMFKTYTEDDGLPSREFNGGAYFRSSDGRMLFGGIDGFTVFRPEEVSSNTVPPPIVFTGMEIHGLRTPFSDSLDRMDRVVLPYHDNFFTVFFSALDFVNPQRNRYRYVLEEFDDDWTEISGAGSARYTGVPYGRHTLRVQAANGDGTWNTRGRSLIIVIEPPYYRTWWFLTAIILVCAGGVTWVVLNRSQNRQRLEGVRLRIARDLHDQVSATITSITFFADAARRVPASRKKQRDEYIDRISLSAQEARDSLSDIIWSVNPENESLSGLLAKVSRFTQESCESLDIRPDLDMRSITDRRLAVEEKYHLWLIFKEAITNALRHADCRSLRVSVRGGNEGLEIVIEDDGRGFDERNVDIPSGLKNIRHRAKELGGTATLISGPKNGTRWEIELPR